MSGYAYAIIGVGGVAALIVVYLLGRAIIDRIAFAGKMEDRAKQAEADLAVAKKQGEIMTRDEDREDTAKSLDRGDF